jgi:hypothetical protein
MRFVSLSVVALAGLFLGAPGCSQPTSSQVPTVALSAPVANARQIGHFQAHLDHKNHTFTITPIGAPILLDENLDPQSVDNLTSTIDQTGGSGNPATTLDLVTTNYTDNGAGSTVTANVELRSFYTRSLTNVYVQIPSVTLNGSAVSGYDATNSDTTNNPLALDATHGLWGYTNGSEAADANGAIPNMLTSQAAGFNTGTREWIFANASDADIDYTIDVYASKGFSTYVQTFLNSNASYVDACTASGATIVTNASQRSISMPFDFTLYNTNQTVVNIARNGQITLGSTTLVGTGTSVLLPSNSAPKPVFFAFWDDLGKSTVDASARMCYATIGTAPNRQFVVEWQGFDFLDAPEGPNLDTSLDFEAFLYEGTGEIDTVYQSMAAVSSDPGYNGRENGQQATVGMQDETATNATQEHNDQDYGTGSGWSYIGSP